MDLNQFFDAEFAEHRKLVDKTSEAVREDFLRLCGICLDSVRGGGKLMFCGNGGSAADAQHLATELTVRYKRDRAAIASVALTTDTSALTAIGNDFGFEQLFSRQIEAIGKPGDVLIAISTSGQSDNIILALEQAKKMAIAATGWSGKGGGRMVGLADPLLIVPSQTAARIQEMHIMLGQMLCNAVEIELGLVPD
jgi:D-sedoheptulose 7-phosphate isomerase